MGFDWEYLLDADGENLQHAYDDLCGDCCPVPKNDWPDDDWEDDDWDDEDWVDEDDDQPEENPQVPCADAQPSWKQIMDRIKQGLPCSDAHAVNIVRSFGAMPFADYMASCPKEQGVLHTALGKPATYQEAADRLYRLCAASGRTKKSNEYCMDLIFCLVKPVYMAMSTMQPLTF